MMTEFTFSGEPVHYCIGEVYGEMFFFFEGMHEVDGGRLYIKHPSLYGHVVMWPTKCSSSSAHTMHLSVGLSLSRSLPPAPKQSPSHLQLLARDDLSQGKNPFTMCALEQLPDNAWQIRVTSVMNLS